MIKTHLSKRKPIELVPSRAVLLEILNVVLQTARETEISSKKIKSIRNLDTFDCIKQNIQYCSCGCNALGNYIIKDDGGGVNGLESCKICYIIHEKLQYCL